MKSTKCTIWFREFSFSIKFCEISQGLIKEFKGFSRGFQGFPGLQKFSRVFQDFQGLYELCSKGAPPDLSSPVVFMANLPIHPKTYLLCKISLGNNEAAKKNQKISQYFEKITKNGHLYNVQYYWYCIQYSICCWLIFNVVYTSRSTKIAQTYPRFHKLRPAFLQVFCKQPAEQKQQSRLKCKSLWTTAWQIFCIYFCIYFEHMYSPQPLNNHCSQENRTSNTQR